MIVANSTWGGLLAEKGMAAIYRAQTGGKVRMTTSPQAHEGLGVKQYAWSSSPLRRYVDLLNQWQLIACLRGDTPPFAARSDALFAVLRDFELTYTSYAEFQRSMERYWCLRWLQQQGMETIAELKPGQRIRLSIESIDYLTLALACRYLETLGAAGSADGVAADEAVEAVD
jgi:exoribonuclease-2